MYVPAGPDCPLNRSYLQNMRPRFESGTRPPDFEWYGLTESPEQGGISVDFWPKKSALKPYEKDMKNSFFVLKIHSSKVGSTEQVDLNKFLADSGKIQSKNPQPRSSVS